MFESSTHNYKRKKNCCRVLELDSKIFPKPSSRPTLISTIFISQIIFKIQSVTSQISFFSES